MQYKRYLTIAVITLVTIYVVKNYLPTVAVQLGL